jgi:hypothetical protein
MTVVNNFATRLIVRRGVLKIDADQGDFSDDVSRCDVESVPE